MRPGISVAPLPSTAVAPGAAIGRATGSTDLMRLPSTRTDPAKGGAPVQSSTLTFLNSVLADMVFPPPAAAIFTRTYLKIPASDPRAQVAK
jgi:hypothetical protein